MIKITKQDAKILALAMQDFENKVKRDAARAHRSGLINTRQRKDMLDKVSSLGLRIKSTAEK